MENYIAYHSVHLMGHELDLSDGLYFSSRKIGLLKRAIGHKVWAVQGIKNGPKVSYSLCGVYIAEWIEPEERPVDDYVIGGTKGISFSPPICLDAFPWFPALLKTQANFSLGFNRLNDEVVIAAFNQIESAYLGTLPHRRSPTIEEFVIVLRDEILTEPQLQLFKVLYGFPDHAATAKQIRDSFGFPHHGRINSTIGGAGRRVTQRFGLLPPRASVGKSRWWTTFATGKRSADGSGYVWTMRPELAVALERAGLVEPASEIEYQPDEEPTQETYAEGRRTKVAVSVYERNRAARKRCVAHHGGRCAVCGFDFQAVYGELGAGYIHVHHLTPLAEIGQGYQVDPVRDLRPICPNCHAMIHRQGEPALTIDQLGALLSARAKRG